MASAAPAPPPPPPPQNPLVTIDGAHGEGGGQILRNAAALAAITRTPLRVHSIRAGRAPKPGLRPQHLHGLELVARLSGFELKGGFVGSSEITLTPPIKGKEEKAEEKEEAGTATRTIRVDPKSKRELLFSSFLSFLSLSPAPVPSELSFFLTKYRNDENATTQRPRRRS